MRVAVVPGLPALLPSYASLVDPVPDLRAACQQAVEWLVDGASSVTVLGDPLTPDDVARGVTVPLAERVAEALLAPFGVVVSTGSTGGGSSGGGVVSTSSTSGGSSGGGSSGGGSSGGGGGERVLVVANGSACRGEKAPGHLDERSFGFDEALGAALAAGDVAALRSLDADLGAELLASGIPALQGLPERAWQSTIDWAGDPFGVQYWVVRWQSGS